MQTTHFTRELANGLRVIVEPMENVRSASASLIVRAGAVHDPPSQSGLANLVASLLSRGAGSRDARDLILDLDGLGVQHGQSAETYTATLVARGLAPALLDSLGIMADMVCRPHLEADHFEACQLIALQELQAMEDDPGHLLVRELRDRSLPEPLCRHPLGTEDDVKNIDLSACRDFFSRHYRARGSILGVAGAVDPEDVFARVEQAFGDWAAGDEIGYSLSTVTPSTAHVESDKVQTQLGIAFPSVSVVDPDYYRAHALANVLGGGMSARLFTEVRERRGLCYGVGASYMALQDRGLILCTASSDPSQAGEALEVMLQVIRGLSAGIDEAEVDRVRAGLRSSLVMQEESTMARAGALARSWFALGRVRTIEEVLEHVAKLSAADLLDFAKRYEPEAFTIVTLGPSPEKTASANGHTPVEPA